MRPRAPAPADDRSVDDGSVPERLSFGETSCYLYRRRHSKRGVWQLYAYVAGEELKCSTGLSDAEAAKAKAKTLVKEARDRRERLGRARLPRFVEASARYRKEVVAKIHAPDGDETAAVKRRDDTEQRITKYLNPYFGGEDGRRELAHIDQDLVDGFPEWRQEDRDKWVKLQKK